MPAKSQKQRGLIFARRDQYGSKKNTPKKWKWIWDEDWENKGKLPKEVNEYYEELQLKPLEKYISDIIDLLTDQGLDEAEIDAILNDPDNMDLIQMGNSENISSEDIIEDLEIYNPVMGLRQTTKSRLTEESFVPKSLDEFLKKR